MAISKQVKLVHKKGDYKKRNTEKRNETNKLEREGESKRKRRDRDRERKRERDRDRETETEKRRRERERERFFKCRIER